MLVTGQLIVDLVQGGTDVTFELQIAFWLWLTVLFANFSEALAEGRGKAQADALRKTRTTTVARRLDAAGQESPVPAPDLRAGRRRRLRGGRHDPRRRRHRRGHRLRRRVGHHRRVGARHPRGRRRPLRRHRRHARALRPHRRAHHRRPRRELPRPHDRPRRGRDPPAHAERDRPLDPARGPLADLRRRLRLAAGHGALRRHDADAWRCWRRCSSPSSRPPSARCSPPSASPA